MHCCSSKMTLCNQSHFWHRRQLPHISFLVCPCSHQSWHGGFILLLTFVFEFSQPATQSTTGLTNKDWGKEVKQYFSLFLTLFPSALNKGWRFSLALLWLLTYLQKHLFIVCYNSSQINFHLAFVPFNLLTAEPHNIFVVLLSGLPLVPRS